MYLYCYCHILISLSISIMFCHPFSSKNVWVGFGMNTRPEAYDGPITRVQNVRLHGAFILPEECNLHFDYDVMGPASLRSARIHLASFCSLSFC